MDDQQNPNKPVAEEGYRTIYTPFITLKSGKRVYPKNARVFVFRVPDRKK